MTSDRVHKLVDRLLSEAEDAVALGEWATVRLRCEAIHRLDPGNDDASFYLAAAGAPTPVATASPAAERRHMAVMFCDLRRSTEISDGLDPEDLRGILLAYQRAAATVIEGFEGYVARYMGDGILVYFGYPVAHEDDPDRAVRAGLGIIAAVRELDPLPDGSQPEVRVGIHFGLAVVAEMGSGSRVEPSDVVGETANIAARVQGIAAPSRLVVTGEVASLLRHQFALQPLGRQSLKGIQRTFELFQAIGEGATAEGRHESGAPFVGRVEELRMMEAAWESARVGHGRIVVLSGEAGFGKTRLCQELRRRLHEDHHIAIQLRGSSFHQNTAFRPIVEHLTNRVLRFEAGIAPEEMLRRLEESLAELDLDLPAVVPPLAAMLNIRLGPGYVPAHLPPASLKEAIIRALSAWLCAIASRRPLVLIVEDTHWLDPSSLETLYRFADACPDLPVLIVFTLRPEFTLPTISGGVVQIGLERLEAADTAALVAALARDASLNDGEIGRLVERSEGIPLYAEELVRLAVGGGTEAASIRPSASEHSNVPPALFGSLMARLDRMGPLRQLAHVSAVIGREVPPSLLAAVTNRSEADVRSGLDRLCEARILARIERTGSYTFSHALIHDVAYESVLRADRMVQHLAVADVIERSFPATASSEPEILAYHLERAGAGGRAIPYLREAAARALAKSANKEAANHLRRALDLVLSGPDQAAEELELRIALGPPLISTMGYSSPEVEANYARAIEVSRMLADSERTFHALNGMRRFHQVRGGPARSETIVIELLARARDLDDPHLRGVAELAAGELAVLAGHPEAGLQHLQAAQPLLERAFDAGNAAARDSFITSHAYQGLALWFLGRPNAALDAVALARSRAIQLESAYGEVYSLVLTAWVHQLRTDPASALSIAEASHRLAHEHGFAYWEVASRCLERWATTMLGDAAALAGLEQGVRDYFSAGARTAETWLLSLLAQARLATGNAAGAMEAIERAQTVAAELGEHFMDPELWRLRAVAGRTLGSAEGGNDELAVAIDLALAAGASSLALRSAAELVRSTSGAATAHAATRLREIIECFPEADGAELEAARLLLSATE